MKAKNNMMFGVKYTVIHLYPSDAPGSEDWNWSEIEMETGHASSVYNVSIPPITVFEADGKAAIGYSHSHAAN